MFAIFSALVILQLSHLSKRYDPQLPPAVASVSLHLQPGDILALLGPSGCGKTTLLRLIAGFERPDQGAIEIAQQVVAGKGCWVDPERRGVGMVFQDYALFPHLTVSQNIAFGFDRRRKPQAAIDQRVQESIALVGLTGLEHRYPHQLSGGQQQRVALARALAPHPFLILLDEPLSNLDVQVRLRLRQELRSILKAANTSAIFVTHDQEEALSIADQVGVMHQGHLEQWGTPEDLYQRPASRFVAEFVTQANLLAAKRQGSHWQTDIGLLPIQSTVHADAHTAVHGDVHDRDRDSYQHPEQVDLMIRQEDLILQPDEHGGNGVVCDRQFLGREYRYTLQTASQQHLIARTSTAINLAIGTTVKISTTPAPSITFPHSPTPPLLHSSTHPHTHPRISTPPV